MTNIEKIILRRDFRYDPPYFYNNDLALRCELGIGKSNREYLSNAKKRAIEIFDILFQNGVDVFFFDHHIYDVDFDMDAFVSINRVISDEKVRLESCLGYQKKFKHIIVRDIPFDKDDDNEDLIRINRICCYPDKKFNAIGVIKSQIDRQKDFIIHLVSFKNNCIFTVYDDRGCDIVFFDKSNFRKFYPLLQKYFLDFDRAFMEQRLNACNDEITV